MELYHGTVSDAFATLSDVTRDIQPPNEIKLADRGHLRRLLNLYLKLIKIIKMDEYLTFVWSF